MFDFEEISQTFASIVAPSIFSKFNKKFGIQIGVKLKTTLKEEIEYICDNTPIKQGKFSPGKHIPIKNIE